MEDISGSELAALAMAGGAFQWLEDEPDIYDDTCGIEVTPSLEVSEVESHVTHC